ncbi:hypothetical protein ACIHCQ_35970 [Streptomyces sp. NPDC052236]|uniref:hypothetical protein n=1 Tax=Streptomyces sp. NPDC052236 TaxID=3365686 RepID=UPI0037CEB337
MQLYKSKTGMIGLRALTWPRAAVVALAALGILTGSVTWAAGDEAGERRRVSLDGTGVTRYLTEPSEERSEGEGSPPDPVFGFSLAVSEDSGTSGDSGVRPASGRQRVTVRIDISRLSGVAVVDRLAKSCRREKARITCSYDVRVGQDPMPVRPFDLRAAPGSASGDRGKVTVTANADPAAGAATDSAAGAAVTRSTDVVVGVPRLLVRGQLARERPVPGAAMPFGLAVRNTGKLRAENGFGISFTSGEGAQPARGYRNCGYDDTFPTDGQCEVAYPLRPGETVLLDPSLTFRIPKDALYVSLSYSAYAIGGPDDPDLSPEGSHKESRKRWGTWRAGEGDDPVLAVEGTRVSGRFEQYGDDLAEVDSHVDIAATADPVRAKEGETVRVGFGVRMRWPDGSKAHHPNHMEYGVRFTAPEGTRVVGVPMDEDLELCTVKGREVNCPWGVEDEYIKLRVERKVPGAVGQVQVVHAREHSAHDRVRTNDAADVPIRVTGVTATLRARRIASAAVPYAVPPAALLVAGLAWHVIRRRSSEPVPDSETP